MALLGTDTHVRTVINMLSSNIKSKVEISYFVLEQLLHRRGRELADWPMTTTRSLLLRGATVLTMDDAVPDLIVGDVLIRDGYVRAVAQHVEAPAGTETLDVAGLILFPGLIDAHQHLWEAPYLLRGSGMSIGAYFADFAGQAAAAVTAEGLYESSRAALSNAIRSGTTSTFDWCHATNTPEHAEASLAAAVSAGTRYVFGFGPSLTAGYYGSDRLHPVDMDAFVKRHGSRPSSLITVAAALRGPDLSPREVAEADIRHARELSIPISMHVGTHRVGSGGIEALLELGLLGPDLQFVHVTDSSASELEMIRDAGARVAIPPIAEIGMGTGTPPMAAVLRSHGNYGLGVDTALSAPPDMFSQMRATATLLGQGEWSNDGTPPVGSDPRSVLAAATAGAAWASWMEDEVGSIRPGKFADLVALRPSRPIQSVNEAYAQVVWLGHPSAIELVLIAGDIKLETTTALGRGDT